MPAFGRFARAFEFEKGAFAPHSAAVAAELAVLGDDAVAGDEEGETVGAVRAGDGADGRGCADAAGDFLIAGGAAIRNVNQLPPDAFLKFRAAKLEGDGKLTEASAEVGAQFLTQGLQYLVFSGHDGQPKAPTHFRVASFQPATVGKFQLAKRLVTGGGKHGTERCFQQHGVEAIPCPRVARWFAECPRKGGAKTAVRFEAVAEDDVIQRFAFAYLGERMGKTQSTAPGDEGHAVVLLEPAAGAFGGDTEGAQVVCPDWRIGRSGGAVHEGEDPGGRRAIGEFRPATFAGAVTGADGLAQGMEEFEMLAFGPRGTGGTAENAGGFDGAIKEAIVAGVARAPGAFHFRFGQRRCICTIHDVNLT